MRAIWMIGLACLVALGLLANLAMLIAILFLYITITGNADSRHEAYICFAIAGGWAAVSLLYVTVTSVRRGRPLIAAPRRAG